MNVVNSALGLVGMYEAAFPSHLIEYTYIHSLIMSSILPIVFRYGKNRYSFEDFKIL